MTGEFVPFNSANTLRRPRGSARTGWITDANGCDIWQGCRSDDGYAYARVDGRSQRVHRIRYEREIGSIPEDTELDHYVCSNGAGGCCNPRHCRPVTHRENMLRSDNAIASNRAKTHCVNGHPLSGDNLIPSRARGGYRGCLTCSRDSARKRRMEKPEIISAEKRAHWGAHKDAINEARRAKRAANPSAVRAREAAQRGKRRDVLNARQRARRNAARPPVEPGSP